MLTRALHVGEAASLLLPKSRALCAARSHSEKNAQRGVWVDGFVCLFVCFAGKTAMTEA